MSWVYQEKSMQYDDTYTTMVGVGDGEPLIGKKTENPISPPLAPCDCIWLRIQVAMPLLNLGCWRQKSYLNTLFSSTHRGLAVGPTIISILSPWKGSSITWLDLEHWLLAMAQKGPTMSTNNPQAKQNWVCASERNLCPGSSNQQEPTWPKETSA